MTRKRSPRRTIETFAAALSGAASERLSGIENADRRFRDPLCLDDPSYTDYEVPPRQDEAMEKCLDCPLFVLCAENARRTKPQWTIMGGVAWVQGRQAHLLSPDRLAELLGGD